MTVYDYIRLCRTMYDNVDYVWLCMTMYDYVCQFMAIYDFVWDLCRNMHECLWLCMTTYDFVWEEERKRKKEKERERVRESKSNFKNFFILSNYQNCSNNLNFFAWFKCSETFHTFQQTSTLFTFVYLCSTDASMQKFCACYNYENHDPNYMIVIHIYSSDT